MQYLEKEFKEVIKEKNIANPDLHKMEVLRKRGCEIKSRRRIYVLDETQDFLKVVKSESKELQLLKVELIDRVGKHIRRNARFLSTPIICLMQSSTEGSLDLKLSDFKGRISSKTTDVMSRIITNGTTILADPSFNQGKFYYRSEEGEHIFRSPYFKPRDPSIKVQKTVEKDYSDEIKDKSTKEKPEPLGRSETENDEEK